MANIKSAKKRAVQAVARRAHNMSRRSMLRTAIKRVLEAIEKNDAAQASAAFATATSLLDKSVKTGLIHKNKAARHKSHLAQKLKALGAAPVAKEPKAKKEAAPKKPAAAKKSETATKKVAAKPAAAKKSAEAKPKATAKKAKASE